ncbi:hypothetical protein [Geoglobus sp.]
MNSDGLALPAIFFLSLRVPGMAIYMGFAVGEVVIAVIAEKE